MENRSFSLVPKFSLEPNRIAFYNEVVKWTAPSADHKKSEKGFTSFNDRFKAHYAENKIERKAHNFKISENARRNLRRKINWLYYLSKSKHVKTYSGKQIYNFKMCFLTLTLPSDQHHCTRDFTNEFFNQFLTEVRQRTGMENYVWRLEFQKNGNVHYHLCSDTYLDYFFVLPIWNRILEKGNYIRPYQKKFQNLSLQEYRDKVDPQRKTNFNIIAKRYAKGQKTNWSQPNSVDVISVIGKKKIQFYISKYFGKDAPHGTICNRLDNAENSKNLRLWFCSRSLSKLKTICEYCQCFEGIVADVIRTSGDTKVLVFQYAKLIFFEISKFKNESRKIIEKALKGYAWQQGYVPQ